MEAISMKLSKKHLYWLLQIIGWGIPFIINATAKLIVVSDALSSNYILFENGSFMLSGILFSHLFRYSYKHWIKWNGWSWKKLILTSISIFIAACGIAIFVEVICAASYLEFENEVIVRARQDYFITFANAVLYLIFWLTLYLAINYFTRNQQLKVERLQLENIAKESQLNTLKSQINPHFMFNSLNNIRGLMLEDVDKARDMLTQLSDMLRFSLARKNDNFVPLHEELAIVKNYIALSKIQLEERLQYKEEIANDVLNLDVPPMLIQMLVENAVKHGVSSLKNGGLILLNISRKSNFLIIEVINDGKLNSLKTGTQVGVENIEQRLNLLYDAKASFNLIDNESQVVATIKLPLI